MSRTSTTLVQLFCERLPEGFALMRVRANQGKLDVEVGGTTQHLHLPAESLETLLDGAVDQGRTVWGRTLPAIEVALRFLSIHLEECNLEAQPPGDWTYHMGGFRSGAPW
jgi:hypothetical protein